VNNPFRWPPIDYPAYQKRGGGQKFQEEKVDAEIILLKYPESRRGVRPGSEGWKRGTNSLGCKTEGGKRFRGPSFIHSVTKEGEKSDSFDGRGTEKGKFEKGSGRRSSPSQGLRKRGSVGNDKLIHAKRVAAVRPQRKKL